MSKIIIGALLGAAIVVAGFFLFDKPEPTPEDRLKEALENVGDASQEAAKAAADVVGEVGQAISTSASQAAMDMAAAATQLSNSSKVELEKMLTEWKAKGIVTEEGFDFEKAATAIKESDLSEATKTQIDQVLEAFRKAPEAFNAQLNELMKQLEI